MSATPFDVAAVVNRMDAFGRALPAIAAAFTAHDARWKPSETTWSVLEIINHLADEEVEDFRTRVDLTLHHPGQAWPPIDPPRAAAERRYNDRELQESVSRFVNERRQSVQWLRSLASPDWTRTYTHPSLGAMSAGSLLFSWAAHDALHMRQIARRQYELVGRDSGAFSVAYAGDWNPGG